jgi:peptide/nickel transport system substrate-binding protein
MLVLFVLGGLVLALLPPTYAQQPRRGGVLRVATIGEPPTLDLHATTTAITAQITYNIYEGLFALTSKYEPRPMLVDRWTMTPDRRTYTFTLRRGVRFHDGSELDSGDVVASLTRWGRMAPRGRTLFANVESLTAPDPLTVVFRLREPYGLLPLDLGMTPNNAAIYPKEVIAEAGVGPIRRFIGTGPYRFVEHLPDRHIRLDRFDGYASRTEAPDGATGRKHAYFDSIFFIPVPDPAVRIAGVQRGEFHFSNNVPHDEYDRLRRDRNLVPYISDIPVWLIAVFNHRSPLMSDRRIRRAFQLAIDHEAVMRATFGHGRFWRSDDPGMMPRGHPMWTDAGREFFNVNDPARARRLLEEAGYRGQPIRWLTTMEIVEYGIAAQVAKPMLERAGFNIELQIVDWATLLARRARPELWEVFSTAHGLRWMPDPIFLFALNPAWPGWFNNRDMNAKMTLLRRHANPNVRRDLWVRMQRLWHEEAAGIKFGDYFLLQLHRRELMGFIYSPTNIWWNSWLER